MADSTLAEKLDAADNDTGIASDGAVVGLSAEEDYIVKIISRSDSDDGTASKQLPKDHFEDLTREGQVIPPLYTPSVWAFLLEQSTRLRRLVDAMSDNTVGLGWEIVPRKDDEKYIEENEGEIENERIALVEFFEHPNDETPFSEMMKYIKVDEESTGQGFMEVTRDSRDVIANLFHVPAHTVRWWHGGEKYVQMRSGDLSKKVFFKEFGDERVMSAKTGKFEDDSEEEIPLDEQASELIQFKLYTPRSSFYGIPRFVSAAQAIAGNKLAQRRNVAFFENDACQAVDAKILTPLGWSTMGDMEVGCEVIGSDGKAHEVTGVYPQKEDKSLFRITFMDGSSTECTDDHMWVVANSYDRKRDLTRKMTLAEILEDGTHYDSGDAKWSIPLVDPVEYSPQDESLPVDPWLLGFLIGNGSLGGGGISASTNRDYGDAVEELLLDRLPTGVKLTRRERDGQQEHHAGWAEFSFTPSSKGKNPLTSLLRDLGLFGTKAESKHIPEKYLRADVESREELLRGLMDSDGHVGDTAVRYVTVSPALVAGVRDLVGGLGGTASVSKQKGRNTFQITIHKLLPHLQETLCRIPSKAKKCRTFESPRWRTIVGIEYLREEHTQCIRVAADDNLYITDNFIVTHNTPRFAVIINGGSLSEESIEMITDFANADGKGPGNANRAMILQAKTGDAFADASKAQITLMPLTIGVQDDASFIKYLEQNNEEIREAFAIGKIFIGTSDDVNRAVAIAMKQITLEQAFEPEIRRYEYRINNLILPAFEAKHTKFRFKRPKTTDVVSESQAQSVLAAAGGVTPNDIREWMHKPKFTGAWADTPISITKLGLLEDSEDEIQTLMNKYGERLPVDEGSGDAASAKLDVDSATPLELQEEMARVATKLKELGFTVTMKGVDS